MMSLEKVRIDMSDNGMKAGPNVINGLGLPLFGFKAAWPGMFGEVAEQGVARAQEGCAKIKSASESVAEAMRESYSSTARSATDYGLKLIEISNANAASAIHFFAHLLGSRSVTDVFTLSAAEARRGFETASIQNKELWELGQKLAAETSGPVTKRVAKILERAA
jgi:phasin